MRWARLAFKSARSRAHAAAKSVRTRWCSASSSRRASSSPAASSARGLGPHGPPASHADQHPELGDSGNGVALFERGPGKVGPSGSRVQVNPAPDGFDGPRCRRPERLHVRRRHGARRGALQPRPGRGTPPPESVRDALPRYRVLGINGKDVGLGKPCRLVREWSASHLSATHRPGSHSSSEPFPPPCRS